MFRLEEQIDIDATIVDELMIDIVDDPAEIEAIDCDFGMNNTDSNDEELREVGFILKHINERSSFFNVQCN